MKTQELLRVAALLVCILLCTFMLAACVSENNGESSRRKGFRHMGSFLDREIKQAVTLSKTSKGKTERNCDEILQI